MGEVLKSQKKILKNKFKGFASSLDDLYRPRCILLIQLG